MWCTGNEGSSVVSGVSSNPDTHAKSARANTSVQWPLSKTVLVLTSPLPFPATAHMKLKLTLTRAACPGPSRALFESRPMQARLPHDPASEQLAATSVVTHHEHQPTVELIVYTDGRWI